MFAIYVNHANIDKCGYLTTVDNDPKTVKVSPFRAAAQSFGSLFAAKAIIRAYGFDNSTSVVPGRVTAYVVEL